MKDKYVGLFWLVHDQLYSIKELFDDPVICNDGQYLRLGKTHEELWELCRTEYNLPNKPFDYYQHGEVMFDTKKHKFYVEGTSKIVHTGSLRNKVVNAFKLPKIDFVIFKGYNEED